MLDRVPGPVAGGRVVFRAGDVGDARAARGQQVLDGQYGPAPVVGDHRGVGRIGGRRERVDDGDGLDAVQGRTGVRTAAGDDDAVHPAVHQVAQVVLFPDRVAAGVAQQDGDLAGPERVLGAEQYGGAEAADAVGRHQPDRPAPPGVQALRVLVGPEPECVDGVKDPLAGLGTHPPAAVQRLRSRTHTDARQGGDVGELRRAGGAGTWSNGHEQTFSWTATTRPSSQPHGGECQPPGNRKISCRDS